MELNKDAYRALEDIVGSENISQDPAIMDSYNQVWANKNFFGEKWSTRPAAVVLPSTTEEVQAIVRACNRYDIHFKPFSSGFETQAIALENEHSITLDLKRMNRILEIDTKNMHAVVEPYVSIYRLQLELAKHGLYIGTAGAGPMTGIVASHCCHSGTGSTQVFCGALGRNVLGCEWVLPTGDVLRMGSAESGSGWFSADGPGFGLRGVLRGHSGTNGGNGVVTKCSAKLYPWYGPPEWEFKGAVPGIKQPEEVLDGYKVFIVTFPEEDDTFDALRELGQAQIAYAAMRTLGPPIGEGNDEHWAMLRDIPEEVLMAPAPSIMVLIGGNSPEELAYREKCLLTLCKARGGKPVPERNMPEALAYKCLVLMWSIGNVREILRLSTEPSATMLDGTEDMIKLERKEALKAMMPFVEKGLVMKMTPFCFHLPYENYSVGSHVEDTVGYDPYDPESLQAIKDIGTVKFNVEGPFGKFGLPYLGQGVRGSHNVWGPKYDNYHLWLHKIRSALDPKGLGDGSTYIPAVFP
jgi:glycolate oxidase